MHGDYVFFLHQSVLLSLFFMPGVVSGEMFRNMQNSEIIRRMTEEFDEVCLAMHVNHTLISL